MNCREQLSGEGQITRSLDLIEENRHRSGGVRENDLPKKIEKPLVAESALLLPPVREIHFDPQLVHNPMGDAVEPAVEVGAVATSVDLRKIDDGSELIRAAERSC